MYFEAPLRFRKGWMISIQKKQKVMNISMKNSWIGELVN